MTVWQHDVRSPSPLEAFRLLLLSRYFEQLTLSLDESQYIWTSGAMCSLMGTVRRRAGATATSHEAKDGRVSRWSTRPVVYKCQRRLRFVVAIYFYRFTYALASMGAHSTNAIAGMRETSQSMLRNEDCSVLLKPPKAISILPSSSKTDIHPRT